MEKPDDLINRQVEWDKLAQLWSDGQSHLIFMHGRRRVGKSWLLHRFAGAVDGIYYQATRGTAPEQLRRLTKVVAEYFDDAALRAGAELPGWEELFEYVIDAAGGEALFFAIDEFPYLVEQSPELTSIIQTVWDRHKTDSSFKLLLCGSHVTLMKQLEERDQPLHGRRTARLQISPFIYRDVARLVPDYDRRTQMCTYGIFGGLPGHLDRLDSARPLAENTERLILDSSSRLYDEATHLLDSFGKGSDLHYSVLFAIATGAHTFGEITKRTGRSAGALWPIIEWLRDMELIERQVPVTKQQPHKSKISLYRLTDPYLVFWYRFIQPIYSSGFIGMADPHTLWTSRIEPHLDDHMGRIFEDICRDFVRVEKPVSFQPLRIGRWWTRNSDGEVDIVVRGTQDELFVAECKWGSVDRRAYDRLRRRARRIADEIGDVPHLEYALFSGRGEFDASLQQAADDELTLYGPEDLLD